MSDIPEVRLLSFREAARLVRVGRDTMARWIRDDGQVPLHRGGRYTRIMYGDLVRLMERRGAQEMSLKYEVTQILARGSHETQTIAAPVDGWRGDPAVRGVRLRHRSTNG